MKNHGQRLLVAFMVTLMLLGLMGPVFLNPTHVGAQEVMLTADGGQISSTKIVSPDGHTMDDPAFVSYWNSRGGLAIFGWPIAAKTQEVLDGKSYEVQYTERNRFEKHPENSPPNDVLLGQFGRQVLFLNHPDHKFGPEQTPQYTDDKIVGRYGNIVDGGFLDYFKNNGGLPNFGEVLSDLLDEGGLKVQYFERARFEYHPENAPPYHILLGQFGRQIMALGSSPKPNPGGGQPADCTTQNVGFGFNLPVGLSADNVDPSKSFLTEEAPRGSWYHRLFNKALFVSPNWNGADSWMFTHAILAESGGKFRSWGNPGQVIFRADNTHVKFGYAMLMTGKYKSQFLAGAPDQPLAVNVKVAAHTCVYVIDQKGNVLAGQSTSDRGDLTFVVPDNGAFAFATEYDSDAPSHEAQIWVGPRDRVDQINIMDLRDGKYLLR